MKGRRRLGIAGRAAASEHRRGGAPDDASGVSDAAARSPHDAGDRGAGEEQRSGAEQEYRQDARADVPDEAGGPGLERLADGAAARLEVGRLPRGHPRRRATEAEGTGGVGERDCGQQADGGRSQRPHRGQDGPQDEHCAGRRQGERDGVAHLPEQPQQAIDERRTTGPAVPLEIERKREKHTGREQAQPEQIQMALREHRQVRPPWRRTTSPRTRTPLLGGTTLGTRSGRGHGVSALALSSRLRRPVLPLQPVLTELRSIGGDELT